jgi:fumarylacetoacetase
MHVTHLKSFVEGADSSGFSLQNLPYGVFEAAHLPKAHIGVAIGNYVVDLTLLEQKGFLNVAQKKPWFAYTSLNYFAKQGRDAAKKVRQRLQELLSVNNSELQNNKALLNEVLIPQSKITLKKPFRIGGFTDFYACEQHAVNVGCLFRSRENALMPNWKRLPVAYNGRASTVYLSGHPVPRPKGQILLPDQEAPIYTACRKLDFELEMGWFIGQGNSDAQPITVKKASDHLFGIVLLNDWSARDIQSFEYQPLGPFLSKSFATSISPWVVTLDALEDFMADIPQPEVPVVEYLQQTHRRQPNIQLKVEIQPKNSSTRMTISEASYNVLYWTIEQMVAHHTVNHCILQTGDLLGTGTISGPERQNFGSLLEITENGKTPLILANGQERRFLEDGDKIIFTAYCENDSHRINFGEVSGEVIG